MKKYGAHDHPSTPESTDQNVLIVPALAIITAFCFGFVLMQPTPLPKTQATASNQTSPLVSDPKQALPAATFSQAQSLSTVSEASTDKASLSTVAPEAETVAPQPSAIQSTNLQSANQSTGNTNTTPTTKATLHVNQIQKTTNQLLKTLSYPVIKR